jgi:hypothetical protein
MVSAVKTAVAPHYNSNYPDGRSVRRTPSDVEWAECASGVLKIAGSLPAVTSNIKSKKEFLRKFIATVKTNRRKTHRADYRNVGV